MARHAARITRPQRGHGRHRRRTLTPLKAFIATLVVATLMVAPTPPRRNPRAAAGTWAVTA